MVTAWNVCLGFDFMAISNEVLEQGMWNLVPTKSVLNIVSKSTIKKMVTANFLSYVWQI
jgi:hypothetical protein